MKAILSYLLKLWNGWDMVSRLFFIFSMVFMVGFFLVRYHIESIFAYVLWCIGFAGIFLITTSKSYFTGFFINSVLLIFLPLILLRTNTIFIDKVSTPAVLIIISYLFLITIIDFLIMAYHVSYNYKNNKFLIKNSYVRFIRIVLLFIQYLILLFSVLVTFAVLYRHLGNVTNEGIQSGDLIVRNWDALYFSGITFFTIGYGDITPQAYSSITKSIIIVQGVISHLVTTILWPMIIVFATKK